ncbi:hypothetical protein ACFW05_03175, partial [Streptomyces albogriseolus]
MTTAPARTTTPPVHMDPAGIHRVLGALEQPCYIVDTGQGVGAADAAPGPGGRIVAAGGPLAPPRRGGAPDPAPPRRGPP